MQPTSSLLAWPYTKCIALYLVVLTPKEASQASISLVSFTKFLTFEKVVVLLSLQRLKRSDYCSTLLSGFTLTSFFALFVFHNLSLKVE